MNIPTETQIFETLMDQYGFEGFENPSFESTDYKILDSIAATSSTWDQPQEYLHSLIRVLQGTLGLLDSYGICPDCRTAVGENYNNCPVCGSLIRHEVSA